MMLRLSAFAAIMALLGSPDAEAGDTGGAPAVRVVTPGGPGGSGVELDDLPEPQLEVMAHPSLVDPPPVPAFARAAADGRPASDPGLDASPRLRKAIDQQTLDASIAQLNACNRAIAARQYEAAIAACHAAVDVWHGNHLAWYALASAYLARQDWPLASAAADRAVQLRPDRAMYQLYRGIALYEAERQRARDAQARSDRKRPAEVEIDRAQLRLDAAHDALALAARLAPELWRAHYYLGRLYRDRGEARHAAEELTAAIKAHPGYRPSYLALAELYRTSDHVDQALAVATLGVRHLPAGDTADLWFEIGMAYDAKRADGQAIVAFGKTLALRPDDALAKLQRGQLYLRTGDADGARRDLDDVMRSTDDRVAADKPFIARLLERIAGERDTRWDCRRSGDLLLCQPRRR